MLRMIIGWLSLLTMTAGSAFAQRPAPTDATTRADSVLRDLVARNLFQGAVVIAHGDQEIYAGGFGFADRERRVPFTPHTPTDAASIAKTFTAAGLLLLAAEGRVDLEAPVRNYLPTFPHATTRVRHLLTHAAGLPDYEWFDPRVTRGEPRTNESHLAVMVNDLPRPGFPPGTGFAYDNVAFDIAAMVIERVTGITFAKFIDARFAIPLKLQAFVRPARFAEWPGDRTRGYRRTTTGWEAHDAYDLEAFYGADNIYLSAAALQRWAAGYRRLMGPVRVKEAMTPGRLDDGRTTGITLGSWYASRDGSRRYYTGHHNGFFSLAYADDVRDLSVAWVANDAPPTWLQAALTRALIAIGEGRAPERLEAPQVADVVENPTGAYLVPTIGELIVRREGRQLHVQLNRVEYDAFGVERGVYYVPGLDAYLRFRIAADGRVALFWDSVFQVEPAVPRKRAPSR